MEWATHQKIEDRFKAYLELDELEEMMVIAMSTLRMFRASVHGTNELVDLLADKITINYHKWFTPTKDNFFNRITKPQLMEILEDTIPLAKELGGHKKKGELADFVHTLFNDEAVQETELQGKKPEFLPKGFRAGD